MFSPACELSMSPMPHAPVMQPHANPLLYERPSLRERNTANASAWGRSESSGLPTLAWSPAPTSSVQTEGTMGPAECTPLNRTK